MDLLFSFILTWYKKVPSWLRWILFLPLSALIVTILLLPLHLIILLLGFSGELVLTIYTIFWQICYLVLIFYFVPNKPILFLWIITAIRSIYLIIFVAAFIYSIFSPELDFTVNREFVAEILVLLCSLYLIHIYKNCKKTEKEGLIILKYLFGISIFVTLAILLDRTLTFLSNVPYIGWLFRIIKSLRDNVSV